MSNIKHSNLPRPPVDPVQEALAALKKIPQAERFTKGQDLLRALVKETLKHPHLSAVIEEAALLCGKFIVEAMDIRAEVERAAMKPEPPAAPSNIVRVVTEPERVLALRNEGRGRVIWDYNPFSADRMGRGPHQ